MLQLRNITISIAGQPLLQSLTLDIAAGEIVTLMGPSGSGKSSLLSFIGGDLSDNISGSGDILLNGKRINDVPAEKRRIGRLFQDDLLFPHMTVGENLFFAIAAPTREERVAMMLKALERAELQGFENRPPHTLSGGQRARVALMRTLMAKPEAVLLDEPFNKLDQALRQGMRDYVFSHIKARGIPALLVTHDRDDAPEGGRVFTIAPDRSLRHV